MTSKRFQRLLEQAREQDDYWIHDAIHEFTEGLHALMARREVNKSELARRMDTSPAYITKVMRGSTNFTLASMVRLVRALNGRLHVRVGAEEDRTQWLHDTHGHRPIRPGIPAQQFREINISHNDNQFEQAEDSEILTSAA